MSASNPLTLVARRAAEQWSHESVSACEKKFSEAVSPYIRDELGALYFRVALGGLMVELNSLHHASMLAQIMRDWQEAVTILRAANIFPGAVESAEVAALFERIAEEAEREQH